MFEIGALLPRTRVHYEPLTAVRALAARLSDVIHIAPSEFGKPLLTTIKDALSEKYPNKVVPHLGLCVAVYDVTHIGESQLYPGNASHHTTVEFRLVIFKPAVGEVIDGTIVSCDEQGVRISLGFFDEVRVPARLLQEGSIWSDDEKVWVWCVPDTESMLYFDLQNHIRFRVEGIVFREAANEAAKAATMSDRVAESRTGSHAATPTVTPTRPGSASTPPPTPAPPSPLSKIVAPQPAMQVIASMDRAGLGLTSWWPEDEEAGEEEDAG